MLTSDQFDKIIDRCKSVIDELLNVTHPMVEHRPVGDTNFLRVLEGSYRRAHHTLQAIRTLADQPHLSSPAYILTRSLIEDAIAIEYMLYKGKEVEAKKFRDFYWIQMLEDNQYVLEHNLDKDPRIKKSIEDIQTEAAKVRDQFWYDEKKTKLRKTWCGMQVDGMLERLLAVDSPFLKEKDLRTIAWGYLQANRKTHFNSFDLAIYLDQEALRADYRNTMAASLPVAIAHFVRLTSRYRDEISESAGKNLFTDVALKANELNQSLDKPL